MTSRKLVVDFTDITPKCCRAMFAVPTETFMGWQKTNCDWYCPSCGSRRCCYGPSKKDQFKDQLKLALFLAGVIAATLLLGFPAIRFLMSR